MISTYSMSKHGSIYQNTCHSPAYCLFYNLIAEKNSTMLQCQILITSITCLNISKSVILYFCSHFWLCYHVSSNPLDQTWQMAPWQKEGGLRINHSGVPLWFMALCAGSNKKGIGISWCFQQREVQLAVIWNNFSLRRKMFHILPFWPSVNYSSA